jgi:hypothetical protein
MTFLQSVPTNRTTLTPTQLLDISLAISRDFSPRFSTTAAATRFSAQQLLAISQEISRNYSPRQLPKKDTLVLLPVDPQHLHVYWQLAEAEAGVKPDALPIPQKLALRLYPEPPATATPTLPQPVAFLEFDLNPAQHAQQLTLPAAIPVASGYRATLGSLDQQHKFTAYISASPTAMPNLPQPLAKLGISGLICQYLAPALAATSPGSPSVSSLL